MRSLLQRLFAVSYRLTVYIHGRPVNSVNTDRRLLTSLAKSTESMDYWSLYKTGPLGLPEREVDFGTRNDFTR